jgi:hypothetical protein
MGFDVNGVQPKSVQGEYFRNNVWWWSRLWHFVCDIADDILTDEDKPLGLFNEGHIISEEKAVVIARRLLEAYLQQDLYDEQIRATALKFEPSIERSVIQALKKVGPGIRLVPTTNSYPFSWDNAKEFAEFCQDSGGFQIY